MWKQIVVSIETSHDAFTAIETFYSLLHELNKLQNLTSGCQVFYKFFWLTIVLVQNLKCLD